MRNPIQKHTAETLLLIVVIVMSVGLSLSTSSFLTVTNLVDLLNISSVNIIFAVGLLVVLIAGGIDISFAVAASVVQYIAIQLLVFAGGGSILFAVAICGVLGMALGALNALLIYRFQIISIMVTISTFNILFGLLMYFSKGVSIYNIPDWFFSRTVLFEYELATGDWVTITLPLLVMVICVAVTSILINNTNIGRQLYAYGDNPDGARRFGISAGHVHYIAYGWLGLMAGTAGLMQIIYTKEVVPNALAGRELDVLAAVVLGGARLGGGKGTVAGCVLAVLLISLTQNGLNLLGITPFAFKMIIGIIILFAIVGSSFNFTQKTKGRA
ncbi:ABC transporter permease [Neorhizobium galegae]|uniref:ABC transporter permease n=1 Tax=Neorhizobium galegae TaxID=399 RepID=UPI0027D8C295|nr:ABC transporter permease [Neorhizobium galegae]